MDAFYASVEQRDNPDLRGKPVVVGGGSNRGVVAAASYEARQVGVRSAMPMSEALRRCPDLHRVKSRMAHYKAVSNQIFAVFREFTPLVEGLSLDEAFLDVTASVALFGQAEAIARDIKNRVRSRTGLTASVGVAENKLVAKIASDLDKPDGLTILTPDHYAARLDPLPVAVIPGIGPQTVRRLARVNIRTVRDLRTAPESNLASIFGRYAKKTRDRAAGLDDRPVVSARADKSISAEETYDTDLARRDDMERELLRLAERTSSRLRRARLAAATVQVKIRRSDFKTCTRQRRIRPATSSTEQIYGVARELLREWLRRNPDARIRLLGVGATNLATCTQTDLFDNGEETSTAVLDQTIDEIRERFGSTSVERASTLERH